MEVGDGMQPIPLMVTEVTTEDFVNSTAPITLTSSNQIGSTIHQLNLTIVFEYGKMREVNELCLGIDMM